MRKLRLIAMLAVVMVTSVMLVACGGKGETNLHKYSDATIGSELEQKIRQAYADKNAGVDFDDVYISKYYGTYNQASVITVLIDGAGVGQQPWSETVGGIEFTNNVNAPIIVFYNNDFHSLQQAYENNFLTLANLQSVASK
jgi:hypothetical protein